MMTEVPSVEVVRLYDLQGALFLEVPCDASFPEEAERVVLLYQGRTFQLDGHCQVDDETGETVYSHRYRLVSSKNAYCFMERPAFVLTPPHCGKPCWVWQGGMGSKEGVCAKAVGHEGFCVGRIA